MFFLNQLKKIAILTIALIVITLFSLTNLHAESSKTDELLQKILDVLTNVDTNVATINGNVKKMVEEYVVPYIEAWMKEDSYTELKTTLMPYTQTLGNTIAEETATDKDKRGEGNQTNLLNDLFSGVTTADLPKNTILSNLTYQSFLNLNYALPTKKTPNPLAGDPKYDYIKNAAGLNIQHFPSGSYRFEPTKIVNAKQRYTDYYNTIMAIESFDAYLLSNHYIDATQGTPLTTLQAAMVEQAGKEDWFKQVASQAIGAVLRQILLYDSQSFVVLTEILRTSKQMLAAQAMANTLLIVNNQENERSMLKAAQGLPQ